MFIYKSLECKTIRVCKCLIVIKALNCIFSKLDFFYLSLMVSLHISWFDLVWFVGFYGISAFVGYLTPNPFLYE